MRAEVYVGDCLDVLRTLPDASVHAIITDPPYGLSTTSSAKLADVMSRWLRGQRDYVPAGRGFMGASWDAFVPPPALWDECLRVLKPGGHALVFAGARTHDLMGLSIRLAGFDLRDSIAWINAQGMPLGSRVKAEGFDDFATTLRPANEPIIMARKPLLSSVDAAMATQGTGALNIGATRVDAASRPLRESGTGPTKQSTYAAKRPTGSKAIGTTDLGRWPSNVLFSHTEGCTDDVCIEGCPVTWMDSPEGSRHRPTFSRISGEFATPERTDAGGPSRYFPAFRFEPKAPPSQRPDLNGVRHPTVKPLALIEWLVALLDNGQDDFVVLDPFAGSGTTLEACLERGVNVIGIERERDYIPLIAHRVSRGPARKPRP